MSKVRLIVAAMTAIVALSAMVAGSASAATGIFINTKALKAGESAALTSKAVVDEKAVLNVPGLSLKISCPGLSGAGAKLVGTEKGEASTLTFEGCSEVAPASCKVEPATVPTEPVTALLTTGTGTVDFATFTPQTANLFATVKFVGTCAFAGEQPVNGKVKVKAATGQTEELAQAIEGIGSSEGNNSLELDKNKAFIEGGKALLSLVATGSKFSFH